MRGATFATYISLRFLKAILAVFFVMFSLAFLVDFVEMLRRSSEIPGVTSSFVAFLVLLRTPTVGEQILPFAVLFGAMIAFLNLSRRLELIVARAAGLSVWQFLLAPMVIIFLLGVCSVAIFNPMAALLKQRADHIETSMFKKVNTFFSDPGLWIQQNSIDGPSILHAAHTSDLGTLISEVTVFTYDNDGRFAQRIDAAQGHLLPGVWVLENVRVNAIGEEPTAHEIYNLATNLTPDQASQSLTEANSVPFWELPGLTERMLKAGLNATPYQLRFQTLLARPLLLVAMVFIASIFSLRFFRLGGIATMILGGVAAGFMLYIVTKLMGDLGAYGVLSPGLAAWTPGILGSMFGVLALLHQEDG